MGRVGPTRPGSGQPNNTGGGFTGWFCPPAWGFRAALCHSLSPNLRRPHLSRVQTWVAQCTQKQPPCGDELSRQQLRILRSVLFQFHQARAIIAGGFEFVLCHEEQKINLFAEKSSFCFLFRDHRLLQRHQVPPHLQKPTKFQTAASLDISLNLCGHRGCFACSIVSIEDKFNGSMIIGIEKCVCVPGRNIFYTFSLQPEGKEEGGRFLCGLF